MTYKDMVFRRLGRLTPGPGYMHFCARTATGADAEYFAQFKGEVPVRLKVAGRVIRKYRQVGRNEAIDLKVGNLACLHMLFPAYRDTHIANRLAALRADGEAARAGRESKETRKLPAAAPPTPPRRRANWVTRWK